MTATYPNGDKRTVNVCPHCRIYIWGDDHYALSAHIVAFHANERFVMDQYQATLTDSRRSELQTDEGSES